MSLAHHCRMANVDSERRSTKNIQLSAKDECHSAELFGTAGLSMAGLSMTRLSMAGLSSRGGRRLGKLAGLTVSSVVALGLLSACGGGTSEKNIPSTSACADADASWPAEATQFEDEVLEIVNQRRAEGATCGSESYPAAPALKMNADLRCAARLHSRDMAEQGYFDHESLDGRSFSDRIKEAGYTGSPVGENIASGQKTPESVMESWMSSDGHCRNIMKAKTNEFGVGFITGGEYGTLWTETFSTGSSD